MLFLVFFVALTVPATISGDRIRTCGRHFMFGKKQVFLSGGNLPWINYGHDYGNNQWAGVKDKMAAEMDRIKNAGGNTIRLWIHAQGESTPLFNREGYVVGTDKDNTFINDFHSMLNLSESKGLFVIPTLWTTDVNQDYDHRLDGLIRDWRLLQSYIREVLIKLAEAVKGHPALAAWDILNEPEGKIVKGVVNCNPCYDTTKLENTYTGWAGAEYNFQQILRFINWQADAIHKIDPGALVTVGTFSPVSNTNSYGFTDHYSDHCLYKAGLRPLGFLDFYQYHAFTNDEGFFREHTPFDHQWSDFGTVKPIVVGEFWAARGHGKTIEEMFDYVYTHTYSGAWSWNILENGTSQIQGISYIRDLTTNGKIFGIDTAP